MSWPIDSFTIHRFRGLEELTLEGMGRINLLVGDNNSGKTSVLEALAIYDQPLDELAWLSTARRRVQGFTSISRVEALKWLFPHGKQSAEDAEALFTGDLSLSGSGSGGLRKLSVHIEEFEGMGRQGLLFQEEVQWSQLSSGQRPKGRGDELERGAALRLKLSLPAGVEKRSFKVGEYEVWKRTPSPESASIPVQILSPFDHAIEELYLGRFRKAVLQDYRESVLEAIQRVDPAITEVEVLPTQDSRAALYLRHERSGRLPVSAFGDGVRRVLLISLALPQATNGNLLIDEIETAIHISVLGSVFNWLVGACKQRNVQLFATTHSLEALDAILAAGKEHPDEIVAYRFPDPARPGPPKRYAGDQLHRLRYERGLDVR